MKGISEENESNVFEEYLKAYFCEHPEDPEGHSLNCIILMKPVIMTGNIRD